MAAGRISQVWADQRALQWGRNSALYANRVLGEFHSADEDGVIPLGWIEAAVERWKENRVKEDHEFETENHPLGRYVGQADGMGVDVARQGEDKTIFALRNGSRICELRELPLRHHGDRG